MPPKEERIRRKKVMQAAGIHVPNTDSSWGPWWDQQWKNAITHTKTNDYYGVPSVWNLVRRTFDEVTGNTTYEAEPQPLGGTLQATDESMGAQVKRTLSNWQHFGDPVRDVVLTLMPDPSKPAKAGKAVVKATPKLVKSVPKLFTKEGAKKAGVKVLKAVPTAVSTAVGGAAVNKASKAVTGKSWDENAADKMSSLAGFHIEPIFGEVTNPGYYYGAFVGNNFANLGRYTLNNLKPWSYTFDKEQLIGLWHILTQPFYKKPPTFFTHRPDWFTRYYDELGTDPEFLEARFENGANWAGIPESEVPRKYYRKNPDGTVSPTEIHTEPQNTALLPDKSDFKGVGDNVKSADYLTPGQVGGEHSDYFYLGDDVAGNSAFEFIDVQKLNPQWKISDWIKKKYGLQKGTRAYNIVDKLGGMDLSWTLGYKPFTIKAGYVITPKGKFIQIDPDYAKEILKTY